MTTRRLVSQFLKNIDQFWKEVLRQQTIPININLITDKLNQRITMTWSWWLNIGH